MSERAEWRGAVMHKKWAMVLCLALFMLFGVTGCGEEEKVGAPQAADFMKERQNLATAQPKVRPQAQQNQAAADAAAGEEEVEYASSEQDYFYDPRGKRDPFRSFRFAEEDGGPDQKEFGPLADFELAQLELSAVVWDANNPRALILDPGGRAYIVREGSQIGKNSGQVIHIGDNLVLVKETYENLAGEKTTKDVELRIRLSQGG